MSTGTTQGTAPRRRRAWRALRGVAALLLIGLLGLWYVLETDATAERLRRLLEQRASAALGGTVSIGRLQLDVLPFHLQVDRVRAERLDQPLSQIDRVVVDISPWGLLQRRVVITNLELDRPHLALPMSSTESAVPFSLPSVQIDLQRLRIRDGELIFASRTAGLDGELRGVALQLAPESEGLLVGDRATRAGQLRIADGRLDLSERNGRTTVLAPLELDLVFGLRARTITVDNYRLSIGSSNLRGRGTIRGLANANLSVDGDLALLDIFKVWVPPGPDDHDGRARFLGSLELRDGASVVAGRLSASDARMSGVPIDTFSSDFLLHRELVALRNVRGRVYGGRLDGEMLVDRAESPSRVQIDFDGDGIDAATLTTWQLLPGWRLAGTLEGAGSLAWSAPFRQTAEGRGELRLSLPAGGALQLAAGLRPRSNPTQSREPSDPGGLAAADTQPDRSGLATADTHPVPPLPLPATAYFRYRLADGTLLVQESELQVPGSRVAINGRVDLDGALLLGAQLESTDLRMLDHLAAQYRGFVSQAPVRRLGLNGAGRADLRVGGSLGAPVVSGSVTADTLVAGALELGSLDATVTTDSLGYLVAEPLTMRRGAGGARGSARVQIPARDYARPLDASSAVLPDYAVSLTLRDFAARGALTVLGDRQAVSGTLTGDLHLQGRYGESPVGNFDLTARQPQIAGLQPTTLLARGRRSGSSWLLERFEGTGWGGSFELAGSFDPAVRRAALTASARAIDLGAVSEALQLTRPLGGELAIEAQLAGPTQRLDGDLGLTWRHARLGALPLGSVAIGARADGGVVAARLLGTLDGTDPQIPAVPRTTTPGTAPTLLPSTAGGWSAAATLGVRRPSPVALQLQAQAGVVLGVLEQLGTPLPGGVALAGQLDLQLSGNLRSPSNWRGSADIAGFRLEQDDFLASASRFHAELVDGQVSTDIVLDGTSTPLAVRATLDVDSGALGGSVEGDLQAALLRLWRPELRVTGDIETRAQLAGTMRQPRLLGDLRGTDLALDAGWRYPLSGIRAQVDLDGDRIQIRALDGLVADTPLHAEGTIPIDVLLGGSSGEARLHVAVRELPLGPLWSSSPTIHGLISNGTVSGALTLRGSGTDWTGYTGDARVDALQLQVRDYRVQLDAGVHATLADGVLSIPAGTRLSGGRTALGISGTVDLANRQLDLRAAGDLGLEPLNVLSPAWGTGGVAELDLRVSGEAPDLAFQGTALLRDVVLSPPPLRQPIEDITAALVFENRRVRIEKLTGELGGGEVSGSGELFLRDSRPQSFRIAVSVNDAVLRIERDVRVRVSADLVHDGTPEHALLSGAVQLTEGLYRRRLEADDAILELLEGPETDPSPLLTAIDLDIHVDGTDNLFIDNNLADVEVSADFDVRGTLAHPVVLGRSRLLGGRLFWNGNNFDVLQGTVEFNNPFETEAVFEIRSRTEIRRYTIDMNFSGSLQRGIAFNYTSTPSLSDLDLFNLLAFGEDPDSAVLQDPYSYQRALGVQATRYLADAYLTELEYGAARVFGVDRFRVAPTLTGSETDATARLTFGKRINRNVYVTYSRLLSSSEDQLLTVEYQITPALRLKGTRDEDGSFGIDFLVQRRIR